MSHTTQTTPQTHLTPDEQQQLVKLLKHPEIGKLVKSVEEKETLEAKS